MSHPSFVFRHFALSTFVGLTLTLVPGGPARAQNDAFVAVTVPFAAQSPTVPYDAIDGEPFYLPAVARGPCAQPIQFRWDVDGDGTWDTNLTNAPNRWNLGHSYTWPRQPASRVFTARVEARCGEVSSTATVPVRVNVNPSAAMRVNESIARALWWAHTQLTRDTNLQTAGWTGVNASYEVAAAAELAHALSVLGHGGGVDPALDPYAEDARWLVNFVLHRMTRINIAAGSDVNANGYGLKFNGCTGNNAHYCGGSGLAGLASFGDFNGVVPANIGIAEVRGRALIDVIRDASEYFYSLIKQNGGWDYPSGGQFNIDTSQTAWVATGLLEARINAGVVHPQSVRDRLYTGIQWNASAANGWWGYRHRTDCAPGNLARTGGGLVTLALILDRAADGAAPNGARNYVQPAVNYIGANFELNAIGANDGNCFIEQLEVSEIDRHFGNYYAMYQVAKALRAFTIAYPTVPNPAGAIDWAARYNTYFLGAQAADGQFNSDQVWVPNFPQVATPLALLVLSPSPFQAMPVAVARANVVQAAPGEEVTFDHAASFARDAAAPLRTFRWNFQDFPTGFDANGDGDTSDPGDFATEDANGDGRVAGAEIRWDFETGDAQVHPTWRFLLSPGVDAANIRVVLEVEDIRGLKDADDDSLQIRVALTNRPPVVLAHPSGDPAATYDAPRGAALTLDASLSYDPDSGLPASGGFPPDSVTSIAWDLDGNGSFESAGAQRPFDVPEDWAVGEHRIPVQVCDDGRWVGRADAACGGDCSLCAVGAAVLIVPPNENPNIVLDPVALSIDEGGEGALDAGGSQDPEGEALTFEWACDAGLAVAPAPDGRTAVVTAAPDLDAPAIGLVRMCHLTLRDPAGGRDTAEIPVLVSPVPPTITGVLVEAAAEGLPSRVTVTATSVVAADAASLRYGIDCDADGFFEVLDQVGPRLTCLYADDGVYRPRIMVTDDDEGLTEAVAPPIAVSNRPPTIAAPACAASAEGVPMRLPFPISDPAGARDPLRCALVGPVAGARIDAAGCTVLWLPTAEQAAVGRVELTVEVNDGDGGTARATATCHPGVLDQDGDGISDTDELALGLDPTQDDCRLDADGDGVSNCREIELGTAPFPSDAVAPALTLESPIDDTLVATDTPDLEVAHAAAAPGSPAAAATVWFSISEDALGRRPVLAADAIARGGAVTTVRVPPGILAENSRYWWTAHTSLGDAPAVVGPTPPRAAFRVDAVREAPTAPRILAPENGLRVPDLRPTLLLANATDPDPDDALRDTCEVSVSPDFARVAATAGGPQATDEHTTALPVDRALDDGRPYHVRCRAIDREGRESPWSEPVAFIVDTGLRAPAAPPIFRPTHDSVEPTHNVSLEVLDVEAPNGSSLLYQFWLSRSPQFPDDETRTAELPEGAGGIDGHTFWFIDGGLGDGTWFWRVRARDPQVAGPMSTARFEVRTPNAPPPVPVPRSPAVDEVVDARPTFVWDAVTDPDGDAVSYDLEVTRNDEPVFVHSSNGTSARSFDELADASYAWRVRARDARGEASGFSEVVAFTVRAVVVLPVDALVLPTDLLVLPTDARVLPPDAAPDARPALDGPRLADSAVPDVAVPDAAVPDAAPPPPDLAADARPLPDLLTHDAAPPRPDAVRPEPDALVAEPDAAPETLFRSVSGAGCSVAAPGRANARSALAAAWALLMLVGLAWTNRRRRACRAMPSNLRKLAVRRLTVPLLLTLFVLPACDDAGTGGSNTPTGGTTGDRGTTADALRDGAAPDGLAPNDRGPAADTRPITDGGRPDTGLNDAVSTDGGRADTGRSDAISTDALGKDTGPADAHVSTDTHPDPLDAANSPDVSRLPDAAGPCQRDDACPAGRICEDGECIPRCTVDTCLPGLCGDDGRCVFLACDDDVICPAGSYCADALCTPGCRWAPDDCRVEQRCDQNHVCVLTNPCLDSEVCGNGLDDECNGVADDPDFCRIACVEGRACRTDALGVCGDGAQRCPAGADGPPECFAAGVPSDERCNDLDDDCDGVIDEDFAGLGAACEDAPDLCPERARIGCAPDGSGTLCRIDDVRVLERCNALDDDCDGLVDDDFPRKGQPCVVGIGACGRVSTFTCSADGTREVCDVQPGLPVQETCNGLDDDCDGRIDEDWPTVGTPCAVGIGTCARTAPRICAPDGAGVVCPAVAGAPGPEACNGLDDDCDGALDEREDGTALAEACWSGPEAALGQGACRAGQRACVRGAWSACEGEIVPVPEACNALDDDCDGAADEGDDGGLLVTACYGGAAGTAAVGVCREGTTTCRFGLAGPCLGERRPAREICDGADDDCDGQADDGLACGCAAGTERPCYGGPRGTDGIGACRAGVQRCRADGSGYDACVGQVLPDFERCNGLDDNCNGAVDDGAEGATPCTVGVGACAVEGRATCDAAQGLRCDAVAAAPSAEACNGLDDDCDGRTDEDVAGLGAACTVGRGACARPGITACRGGGVTCLAEDEALPSLEVCNGLDDDCDGQIDDHAAGTGEACSAGSGACVRAGVTVCRQGVSTCDAQAAPPGRELCNGRDDDCDGATDEDLGVLTCGLGACRHTVAACEGGAPRACDPRAGASPETCNGLDDDCDGPVDEETADAGGACSAGIGACRADGHTLCREGTLRCDAVPQAPDDEVCNGLDDDCNGTVDEGVPGVGGLCDNGLLGVCRRDGRVTCASGVLTCNAPPIQPGVEACNGLDDDCDGVADDLGVCPDVRPPSLSVALDPNPVDLGEPLVVRISAQDDESAVQLELTLDGEPLAIGADGTATVVLQAVGRHTVVVRASDDAGNQIEVTEALLVRDPDDHDPPVLEFTSPDEDASVDEVAEITGRVEDANLASWRLEIRSVSGEVWRPLASGEGSIAGGHIGSVDPSLFENGLYTLRLAAEDAGGLSTLIERPLEIAGEAKPGRFRLSFVDLQVPVAGIPITVERTYDSRVKDRRDFGIGWTVGVKQGRYENNITPGEGWEVANGGGFFNFPCARVGELATHKTEVRPTETEVYRFALTLTPTSELPLSGQFCQVRVAYRFVSSTVPGTATLVPLDGDLAVHNKGTSYLAMDIDREFDVFDVQRVRLTTPDGRVLDFDRQRGLERMADRNGNDLTIDDAGVRHTSGKEIRFHRDALGRITRITDPNGQVLQYDYDAAGDLVAFVDRTGAVSRFTYDLAHNLTEIEDPLGHAVTRQEFDEEGHLVAIVDAHGNRIEMSRDLDARTETLVQPDGGSIIVTRDAAGRELQRVDELGQVHRATWDARGNPLTRTDPAGNVTRMAYDADGRKTSETDPLGNVRRFTYDANNRMLSETDPAGAITRHEYDERGNRLADVDPLGNRTSFTYSRAGDLLTQVQPDGGRWTYTYDAYGRRATRTDPTGALTRYQFDENGNQTSEVSVVTGPRGRMELTTGLTYDASDRRIARTDPLGNVWRTEYDARGLAAAEVDPLGRRRGFEFDALGNLVGTVQEDGTSFRRTLDAAGREIAITDESGRTVSRTLDALGRAEETQMPGGEVLRREFGPNGEITRTTDALGQHRSRAHDAAGRRIGLTGKDGEELSWRYDAAGRVTSRTNADGTVIDFAYDALGRLTSLTLPDGREAHSTFDAMGREITRTVPGGETTAMTYDTAGRLTSVRDPAGVTASYGWDEAGNLTAMTDGNGRTTRYEYDAAGRRTREVLPDGTARTTRYDAVGNAVARTDAAGRTTTYAYDGRNRIVRVTLPSGDSEETTYTPTGQRATLRDTRGITRWTYDAQDRMLSRTDPDGREVRFTYDVTGRRSAVTTPAGVTRYTFTPGGWIDTLTSPEGGVTRFEYGPEGLPSRIERPNGVVTAYVRDAFQRITRVEVRDARDTLLGSYAYTFDARGRRATVAEEPSGRRVAYAYDAAGHLVRESIEEPNTARRVTQYTYDGNGNRTRREDTVEGVTEYVYDSADRLVGAGGTAFTYDAVGNLIRRTDGRRTVDYTYDDRGRLTSIREARPGQVGARTLDLGYDADGNLVQQGSTRLLVDEQNPFTHWSDVLVEFAADGTVQSAYTLAYGVVSERRDGVTRHVVADGGLSTRMLLDAAGRVTDQFTFDAFGRLLRHTGDAEMPYLYTGQRYEAGSELYALRARWMSPTEGRFLTPDPVAPTLEEPRTLNRYGYAGGDPVNSTDPRGEDFSLTGFQATMGIMGTLATVAVGGFGVQAIRKVSYLSDAKGSKSNVKLCSRPTQIIFASDKVPTIFHHYFLVTSKYLQGYGAGGGYPMTMMPEDVGNVDKAVKAGDCWRVPETVSETCVDAVLANDGKQYGNWIPPVNYCFTAALEVLRECDSQK